MQVELVSPEAILYSGEAHSVLCRTSEGDIEFLDNHAPFLGALEPGTVVIGRPEGDQTVNVEGGGFVEVKDNKVIILSDAAELA